MKKTETYELRNEGQALATIAFYTRYFMNLSTYNIKRTASVGNANYDSFMFNAFFVITRYKRDGFQATPEILRKYLKLESKLKRKFRQWVLIWDKMAQAGEIKDYSELVKIIALFTEIEPYCILPETLKRKIMLFKLSKEY